jgi:hypothetical protein
MIKTNSNSLLRHDLRTKVIYTTGSADPHWTLRPERAQQHSPGQRPGNLGNTGLKALKGRNKTWRIRLLCPFRAWVAREDGCSQGVALGTVVAPFRAIKSNCLIAWIPMVS